MADGVRTIVRYGHGFKLVTFEDARLATAVERFTAEEPPGVVLTNLDAPPGTYAVESLSRPGYCWTVRLDAERGSHIGEHNCPARAENPRANYPCRHIAGAWLRWKQDHDNQTPFLRRLNELQEQGMSEEQTTALALRHSGTAITPYYVPTREELSNTLSLAKVLMETRGAAIPKGIQNVQEAAAVIMAGREMGMDPMTAFRRFYVVDGRTQIDAQGLAAKIQEGGGDLIYHCDCETCADVELVRPGRPSIRIKYTMAQAVKSGSNENKYGIKTPWRDYPGDMLIWKAVTRLARRGAADLINAVSRSMVRIEDFDDAVRQLGPEDVHEAVWNEHQEQRALPANVDAETGEIIEQEEEPPSNESEAESPSASAGTQSGDTTLESTPASTTPATTTAPEPGPAPSPAAAAAPTGPSGTSTTTTSAPPSVEATARGLNYATAFADKATNHKVLSAFQRAIKGMGTLPADCEAMTLAEVVEAMGGSWPE